ncbi:MarR family winged helix-turn-helix transcriptional regulator [Roseovarius sp. LXJ103]|uniref:MarR family winged helix-turn-helix transcriptional regulator n=1 Tax=Roseovarius carneus TaxID=2853164 RepID=UPI000D6214A4|nr:MarR family winged helix-turn-helix transcriptional regulator [Roseovarius carneus]MBZ8117730.1 MarR family winged helix-turn-helix transcriptional regulator [Roseovarius carneus]PWE36497.1 MarR family transcriptional regulator [Pelagicola sp. LXJ1103]
MSETAPSENIEEFDLKNFLPYLLNIAGEVTSRRFEESYKTEYGMSRTQWRVLFHLGRYGDMTARSICDRARTHKTKVSRAVSGLETMRFLERVKDLDDRRFETLSLTTRGYQAYNTLCGKAGEFDRELSAQFTSEENAILRQCLRQIAELPKDIE